MKNMNYEEAVTYVIKNKTQAFSYLPEKKNGKVIGGEIYILEFNEDEDEPDDFSLTYIGGIFRSSSVEEDYFNSEDIPEEARSLTYQPAKCDSSSVYLGWEVQCALKLLAGYSEDEVIDEYPCETCDTNLFETGRRKRCTKCN